MFAFINERTRTFFLSAAFALAAAMTGCGGGGGSGGGGDTSPLIGGENAGTVAALTYGVIEMVEGFASLGDDLVGEEVFLPLSTASMQTPEGKVSLAALTVVRQSQEIGKIGIAAVDSHPCDSGSFDYSVTDTTTTIHYNQCQFQSEGMSSSINGTMVITELAPLGGYAQRQRYAFDNLSFVYTEGSDSLAGTMDGWQEISSTGSNFRIESNLGFSYASQCQGASESLEGQYQLTMSSETAGDDTAYVIDGQMSVTGHPDLNGTFTVQTLETIHLTSGADHPYAGRVKVSAGDGSSVTIRYVEGGLYIDDVFHTWAAFEAEFLADGVTFDCFWNDDAPPQGSDATLLTSGQEASGSVAEGEFVYYTIEVPAGAARLEVDLFNLSQDADLWVQFGSAPTYDTEYDCDSWNADDIPEQCVIESPQAGTWYIGVEGWDPGITSYTLRATLF